MIELSNGHRFEFLAASGALGFDGRGWPWEWPLRWSGFLNPHLFTISAKTILFDKRRGNLRWYAPWRVIRFISDQGEVIHPLLALIRPDLIRGTVNSIGLTGPGFNRWLEKCHPVIKRHDYNMVVSITGERGMGCIEMTRRLNGLENVVAIEFNASCPNTDPTLLENVEMVVRLCHKLKEVSTNPVILKLSYVQPYLRIAKETEGVVEAITINSVPWKIVFREQPSPLVKYGGGGVSGPVVQKFTWQMVSELSRETVTPVVGTSVWEYEDIRKLNSLGASAIQFGAIFLRYPYKPSSFVLRWMREQE